MATTKQEEMLDWYGNPLPKKHGIGICISNSRLFFMGEVERDGTKYIRAYTPNGVPGDRLALDDCHVQIKDESGKVLYDSQREPPPDAKLFPGYIGYAREKQLKRYFPV
jgi:hypothetical protein